MVLMNGRPDHSTTVCASLRWSSGLRVARLPAGSWHGIPRWLHGLCMRCIVSCGSTSFPWLVFFFGSLLWECMIHMHTGRWIWQGSESVVSYLGVERNTRVIPNWFQPCRCCCCLRYPGDTSFYESAINFNVDVSGECNIAVIKKERKRYWFCRWQPCLWAIFWTYIMRLCVCVVLFFKRLPTRKWIKA